jgi:hypothetical protein
MYYIVESKEQFKLFSRRVGEKYYVEVIPYHDFIHPRINQVSLIYIRPLEARKGYIIPISHNEAFSVSIMDVRELISSYSEVYVRDKKFASYFLNPKNLIHIPLLLDISKIQELQYPGFDFFYKKYDRNDINKIISVSKHYERCEEYFDILEPAFKVEKPTHFEFYNKALDVFKAVEYPGIYVNIDLINANLSPVNTLYSIKENIVYTQYNTDTTTKRPSNRFNGINFAAIPKTEECRSGFIPRNDRFIDIDIDSYHPTIIAKQIGYDFGDESIHEHLAKMYGVDYNTSKELTFKQLYGGIFREYKDIEFFAKTQKLIDELWEQFNTQGYIECPISKYRFEKSKLDKMTPQKLFSYWVQNLETSQNVSILRNILSILKGHKSKLVLYTYDSFLIDMSKDDSHLLEQICSVFENKGLKYKIKHGVNYWDFKKF